jgi:CubicO group peptidase (beta-lactamase class C family)
MNWDSATATAGSIAQDWTTEDGPGGAIVLFDDRDIRAQISGGLADLAHDLPFQPETTIRYASISKHFLTSLLLTGTPVQLTDPLGLHLILPEAAAQVTVARALDMTGGLPDMVQTLWLLGVPPSTTLNRHRLMDATSVLSRLNFEPGSEISYSNTGYRLVQAALAAKGLDYPEMLRERLFRPLGLGIRLPEDETEPVPGLATGYWHSQSGWRSGRYGLHISASGGLAGSAVDLAVWGQALLGDQLPATGLLARLTALRHLNDGTSTNYGLGLARTRLGGRTLFGHGGSLPGYKTHLLLDPTARAGVVVVSNREDTVAAGLAQRVMAALHGMTLPTPAAQLLPKGLFVADEGPFWLQHHAGIATYLGATETLYDAGDGWAANNSAALPMHLTAQGGDIVGEIGHVARHFRPVPPRPPANPDWAGRYTLRLPGHDVRLEVEVRQGMARLFMPPLGQTLDLRPLDDRRAIAQMADGPVTLQLCLNFEAAGLTLATQRSRGQRFSAE